MGNLWCRPELHGDPTREQYQTFHDEMEQLGFSRVIERDGKTFHLPPGEYLGIGLRASKLLQLQISAAAIRATNHDCRMVIIPISNIADILISNLQEDKSFAAQLKHYVEQHPSGFTLTGLTNYLDANRTRRAAY